MGDTLAGLLLALVVAVLMLLAACVIFAGIAFGWWDGCPDFLSMCITAPTGARGGADHAR